MNKNNAMQFLCVNLADNLKRNKAPYGHMEPAAYQRQYLLRAFLTRTARQVVSFMLVTTSTMVLLPTPIFALEDEWGLDEPSMVISATRINQSVLSAPNAVTIIDAAMIKASGYTNLADVFRLVPGMNVAHVNGRKYAVSYHGGSWSDTNWMQVLINGRSLFMPTLSVIDWDTIGVQIEDIEKIEVIRGPSASAYGSNSFSAAINIITKPIALDSDWQINSRLGTQGEQRHYAKVTSKLKEADVRVSVNSIESDGFDHQNDFKHISSANFGYENQLNHRNAIKGYLAFSEGDTGSLENTYIPDNNRHRDIEAYSGHVIWEHELKAGNAFQAQIYHNA
ncbi:MAG: TonB-dependent receptor plug domain-containing protein, partial [Pseudomonadota bacterium]|nr:TonB-dependent receptor plug domain-containing protein [Pseudomonadota bacterium]